MTNVLVVYKKNFESIHDESLTQLEAILEEMKTTTNDPFSPLFETAVRRTHRGWCLSSMEPNQG